MKFLEKITFFKNDSIYSVVKILSIPLIKIEQTTTRVRYYLFNIRIASKELEINFNTKKLEYFLSALRGVGNTVSVVWFDHSLRGGTAVYSERQITQNPYKTYLRIQYLYRCKYFQVTLIGNNSVDFCHLKTSSELYDLLRGISFNEIIVNSLVGYIDLLDILQKIECLKFEKQVRVIFNLHDYYCICPNCNLMFKSEEFCNIDFQRCLECLPEIPKLLLSGIESPILWRSSWKRFLEKVSDQVVVFSKSSQEILSKVYPNLKEKILVIPHSIPSLSSAKISKHDGYNIAFLGSINSRPKGSEIIENIVEFNKDKRFSFYVIGDYPKRLKGLGVTGRYKTDDLSKIVSKLNIDLIIIPSICPETFSYTTNEAIQLQIPVACFDIGAQARAVRAYTKGIIFTDCSPEAIMDLLRKHFSLK